MTPKLKVPVTANQMTRDSCRCCGSPTSKTNDANIQHFTRRIQEREDKTIATTQNDGKEINLRMTRVISDHRHCTWPERLPTPDPRHFIPHTTILPPAHHDLHRHIPTSHSRPDREHVVSVRLIEASHSSRDMRHGVREQDALVGGNRALL